MCRGGKDGVIRRCKSTTEKHGNELLRKKVKYRADKAGLTSEEWKAQNPGEFEFLSNAPVPAMRESGETYVRVFQDISETRKLADDVPIHIADHIAKSRAHIDEILAPDEIKALAGYTGFAAGVCNTVLLNGSTKDSYYAAAPPWRESDNGPTDFATPEDLKDYMETMDSVLSHRVEEPRVLYRGIPIYSSLQKEISDALGKPIHVSDKEAMIEGLENYYQPGKVFDYTSYVSTTHSAHYAAERTDNTAGTDISYYDSPAIKGIMFEMKTNAGLDVTGLARFNAYEREVVLPRDTRFKVVSIHAAPESYDTVSGYDHDTNRRRDEIMEDDYKGIAMVVQMVEVDADGNEIQGTEPHVPSALNDSLFSFDQD